MKTPIKRATRHPAVIDTLGAARTHPGTGSPSTRRTRPPRGALLIAVAALVLAVLVWIVSRPSVTDDAHTAPAQPSASSSAPAAATDGDCVATPGGHDSATAAIQGFENGYYTARSAEAAWKFLTPTSSVLPAPALQPIIDALPQGTSYCLRAIPLSEDVFMLVLVERRPDQPRPKQFNHTVTTKKIDGLWYVDTFK